MSLYRCRLSEQDQLCWTDAIGDRTIVVPKLVVLFDVSASMGRYIGVIHNILRNLINEYRLDQVVIITFGAGASRSSWSWKTIDRWTCPGQEGSTRMLHAVRLAIAEASSFTQYMIISDGQVHDLKQYTNWGNATRNSEWLLEMIQKQQALPGTVQVAGMRISADGDTQAVSCFFKFHNHPNHSPMLLDSAYSEENIGVGLLQMFDFFKQGCTFDQIKVSGAVAADIFSPIASELSVGQGQIFIGSGAILVNGKKLVEIDQDRLPPAVVERYLEDLARRIRTLKVLGSAVDIKRVNTFMNNIGSVVLQPADHASGFRGNVRAVMRDAQSRYKTIINEIQQLLNLDNVDRLNAQQQADFLRTVDSSTTTGRRLAKRHAEADDPETVIRTAITKIMTGFKDSKNQLSSVQSFLSLASTGEILKTACDEFRANRDGYENLGVMDLLRCIGAVGVAFTARVGDYPDPWNFRVDQVWFGQYLAQPDLINAFSTGTALTVPGHPDRVISGVDPIGTDDMATMKFYCHSGINRFHASVFMRRVIAVIPKDALALKSAVLMRMQDLTAQDPTELRVKDTLNNWHTLRAIVTQDLFSPEFLTNPLDPKLWQADFGITNVLKVFCWACVGNVPRDQLLDLFKNMLRLDIFYLVRSKFPTIALDERIPIIHQMLGIDPSKDVRPTPIGEPEPTEIVFPNHYDEAACYERMINWISPECIDRWNRLFHWRLALNSPDMLETLKQARPYLDTHAGLLKTCLAALMNRDLADYLTNPDKEPGMIVEQQYRTMYEEKLKQKLQIEKTNRLQLAIDRLTWSCDTDEFIEILNHEIPNSEGNAYGLLIKSLAEQVQVPLLDEKVWILAFGRVPDSLDNVIWNNGNIASLTHRKLLQKILSDAHVSAVGFLEAARRLRLVAHVYRQSDKPNRHGHCNSNPFMG